ncbi:hypothetical protein [Luteolibacter pohnpeiensis]|uniref:hypothetical protein n=1 Tax=Luteolibacter pohnpeiensis TaxID=454153 RepID=UPI001F1A8B08|nr:hypothetical protein [Luteolibacter pohnpeiensis]
MKRIITQRASKMTAMALMPIPLTAPDGIRVYDENPKVEDQFVRGESTAERIDTLTYLIQKSGDYTLPGIEFHWWNPGSLQMESKKLSSISITASAPSSKTLSRPFNHRTWLLFALLLITTTIVFRSQFAKYVHTTLQIIYPIRKRVKRRLIRSCRKNRVDQSLKYWGKFQHLHPDFVPGPRLLHEIKELQRRKYGRNTTTKPWSGTAMAELISISMPSHRSSKFPVALPKLNTQ